MSQRVLILGATSAIASEVARLYAGRGARLHLVGRNADKLERLVDALPAGLATSAVADFSKLDDAERVVRAATDSLGGIDVALVAHGDLGDQLESERSFAEAQAIITTNFTSVVALLI